MRGFPDLIAGVVEEWGDGEPVGVAFQNQETVLGQTQDFILAVAVQIDELQP